MIVEKDSLPRHVWLQFIRQLPCVSGTLYSMLIFFEIRPSCKARPISLPSKALHIDVFGVTQRTISGSSEKSLTGTVAICAIVEKVYR